MLNDSSSNYRQKREEKKGGGLEGGAKEGREREDFQSERSDRSQQKSVAMT